MLAVVAAVAVIPLLMFLLQVFRRPWPGIMRSVYRNHERFENTYFKKFPGFYVTGDGKPQKKKYYYIYCLGTLTLAVGITKQPRSPHCHTD